jgi:transposase
VVASAIAAAHLPLAVINPRQIRDFARSTGKLAKTDRLDAAAHSPSKRRASFDALSLTSPKPFAGPPGPSRTPKPRRWESWWRAVVRSSR